MARVGGVPGFRPHGALHPRLNQPNDLVFREGARGIGMSPRLIELVLAWFTWRRAMGMLLSWKPWQIRWCAGAQFLAWQALQDKKHMGAMMSNMGIARPKDITFLR